MRDIKFRAFSTNVTSGNKIFYDVIVNYGCAYQNVNDLVYGSFLTDKPENIEQYTGLKDKNGKEIYEGDIVTRGDGDFVIRYKNDKYYIGYVASKDDENQSYIYPWYDGIEIISNIHESV